MTNQPPEQPADEAALTQLLHYALSEELIAQQPVEPRDASRLLVVDRSTGTLADRRFRELTDYLHSGDLLVLNDTRVMNARLRLRRASGGQVELLLLRPEAAGIWRALARPARRLRAGEALSVLKHDGAESDQRVIVRGRDDEEVLVEHRDFERLAADYGDVPLPPYIRAGVEDPERYQTVVAKREGSAAAPTAGLHFTPELLASLQSKNVRVEFITLHIGLGTFQPIKSNDPYAHQIHEEYFHVPSATTDALRRARENGTRVVGVGTTVVRTLETIATELDSQRRELSGWSKLYIHPPYDPRVVDAVVTNFHLPRTTLLMLVAGFTGVDLTLRAYRHAIAQRYRFYSFGDAMLIV